MIIFFCEDLPPPTLTLVPPVDKALLLFIQILFMYNKCFLIKLAILFLLNIKSVTLFEYYPWKVLRPVLRCAVNHLV